jgi:hypothetical protein
MRWFYAESVFKANGNNGKILSINQQVIKAFLISSCLTNSESSV